MENMIIRKTLPTDIPIVAMILSSTEAWTCYGITYDIAMKMLYDMPDESFVGVIDNEIVGFITLRGDGVGNIGAYVRMVVVKATYRGKMLGSKLIDHIAKIAFQKTHNLFLICSAENTMARRFYEKIGFVAVGSLADLVIKDHNEILYRKTNGPMKE